MQPVRTWVPISVYENNIDCLRLARQASSLSFYDTYIIVKAGRRRILLPLKGKLNKNKTIFFTKPEESFYAPSYQSGYMITFGCLKQCLSMQKHLNVLANDTICCLVIRVGNSDNGLTQS